MANDLVKRVGTEKVEVQEVSVRRKISSSKWDRFEVYSDIGGTTFSSTDIMVEQANYGILKRSWLYFKRLFFPPTNIYFVVRTSDTGIDDYA